MSTRTGSRNARRNALKMLTLPVAAGLAAKAAPGWAQAKEVKVGLLVPLSGLYARPGAVMRMGAEMAIDHINKAGGVKALGGAHLRLVVLDCGDSTEKAKNAAQLMVSRETDLVAASGSYLSSFTLAVTEVTERAKLPVLTLSYSDLITSRGFKYVFQTSATGVQQAEGSLPALLEMAEKASGKRPQTIGIVMDNTAASVSFVKPMRDHQFAKLGLKLVVDETFTPPLANATPLIQKVRSARPDILILLPTVISDAKLLLEKMNEFGLGRGKLPTIANGAAILDPDLREAVVQNIVPKFSETPGSVDYLGSAMGAHNDEIYRGELGYSDEKIAALMQAKVI